MAKRQAVVEVDATDEEMRAALKGKWSSVGKNKKGVELFELDEDMQFEYKQTIPGTHCYIHERKLATGGNGMGPSIQSVLVNPGIRRTLVEAFELEQKRPSPKAAGQGLESIISH